MNENLPVTVPANTQPLDGCGHPQPTRPAARKQGSADRVAEKDGGRALNIEASGSRTQVSGRGKTMDWVTHTVERQLTVLLRRANRIHLSTQDGEVALERSAYAIMCQLADDGPQRLGSIAAASGLDPSTITSQVRALERADLAFREQDPTDRRASILSLTGAGRDVLERTRHHRRARLDKALADWPERDIDDLARLLSRLNVSLDCLDGHVLIAIGVALELAV